MVISFNLEQQEKRPADIVVKFDGNVILVRFLQPPKTPKVGPPPPNSPMPTHFSSLLPKFTTLFGIETLSRLVQRRKAPSPIFSTPSGIVTFLMLVQLAKAPPPIFLTLFGIVIFTRLVLFSNARSSIATTLSRIV